MPMTTLIYGKGGFAHICKIFQSSNLSSKAPERRQRYFG